jgi:hypothetical protein
MRPNVKTPPGGVASGETGEEGNLEANSSKQGTMRARIKDVIVRIALAGLLPFAVADWLIQRAGLSHD